MIFLVALAAAVWGIVLAQSWTKRANSGRRNPAFWVILAACAVCLVPSLAQTVTGIRLDYTVAGSSGPTGIARLTAVVLLPIAVSVGAWAALKSMGARNLGALFVGILPTLCVMALTLTGGEKYSLSAVGGLAILLTLGLSQPRVADLRAVAYATFGAALISLVLGVVVPSIGRLRMFGGGEIASDKALIGSELLRGMFEHPNVLAATMALGGTTTLLLPSRRQRTWFLSVIVLALLWSSGRGSIAALGVALGAALLIRNRAPAARRAWSAIGLAVCASAMVVLPFVSDDPMFLSQRGQIWAESFEYVRQNPILGNGIGFYNAIGQYNSGLPSQAFNGHNLFVDYLTTGGVLLVAACVVSFGLASLIAVRAAADGRMFPFAFMASFFLCGALEVLTKFRDVSPGFFVTALPLVVIIVDGMANRLDVDRAGRVPGESAVL